MQFKKSFQILRENFLKIVVFDILFFVSVYLLKIFFIDEIKVYMLSAQSMLQNLQNVLMQTTDMSNMSYGNLELLNPILSKVLLLLVVFFIFLFLSYNIFHGIAWNLSFRCIKGKVKLKIDLKYLGKFFVLNLIWLLLIVMLNYLLGITYFSFLVVCYFALISYVKINEDNLIKGIKESFKLGIKKIHLVLLRYLVLIGMLLGVFILLVFLRIIINLVVVNSLVNVLVGLVVVLVFLVWSRIFILLNFENLFLNSPKKIK